MLILRMLSGLLVATWGFLGRRRKGLVTSPLSDFQPTTPIAAAASSQKTPPSLHWSELGAERERCEKAAAWHAKIARKAVVNLDGEGVLEHMRHFRQYSRAARRLSWTIGSIGSIGYPSGACYECGSTAADRDMVVSSWYGGRLVCIPCSEHRDRPMMWSASGSRRVPVREMGNQHLVNSAMMIRRYLRNGEHPVSDDRVRMCGHVLEECSRRGLDCMLKKIATGAPGQPCRLVSRHLKVDAQDLGYDEEIGEVAGSPAYAIT